MTRTAGPGSCQTVRVSGPAPAELLLDMVVLPVCHRFPSGIPLLPLLFSGVVHASSSILGQTYFLKNQYFIDVWKQVDVKARQCSI